jgi:hypothetical protein
MIVISKVGYVQNSNLHWARDQESNGKPIPDIVKVSDNMWYVSRLFLAPSNLISLLGIVSQHRGSNSN